MTHHRLLPDEPVTLERIREAEEAVERERRAAHLSPLEADVLERALHIAESLRWPLEQTE